MYLNVSTLQCKHLMSALKQETNFDDIVSRLYKLASEFVPDLKINNVPSSSGNLHGLGFDSGGGAAPSALTIGAKKEGYINLPSSDSSSSSNLIVQLKSRRNTLMLTFAIVFVLSFLALYFLKPDFVTKKKTKDYIDVYEISIYKVVKYSAGFGLIATAAAAGAIFFFQKSK
jgi:hypothetical protein